MEAANMNTRLIRTATIVTVLLMATTILNAQTPAGTAFTYQGQLKLLGTPLDDTADFEFILWDAAEGGNPVSSIWLQYGVYVDGGQFTVPLNFGSAVFDGEARWLEIAVRAPAGSGGFTILSPRQELTPAPYALYALNSPGGSGYWTANGDDIYYDAGRVGIGWAGGTFPLFPLDVRSSGGTTLYAYNSASGQAIVASSSNGTAIVANSSSGSGDKRAVDAAIANPDGFALYGLNEAEEGAACAVYGQTLSPVGFGGYFVGRGYFSGNVGIGTSSPSHPLHVQSSGASAIDVNVTAASGFTRGVRSEINSPYGAAVDGMADAAIGTAAAVRGGAQSPDGVGVFGYNDAESGNAIGVRGETGSDTGFGGYFVGRGYFSGNVGIGTSSPSHPLHVQSSGTSAIDVNVTTTSGATRGVRSEINSPSGAAVDGIADATTGTAAAVRGGAQSPDGVGVFGYNDGGSGAAIGVRGETGSDTGFGGYFVGRGYFSDRVGIGTENPVTDLHVAGDAVIDGNVGIGTSSPPTGLKLRVAGDTQTAIKAETTAQNGWAVFGVATAASSNTIGVNGTAADSSDGVGVYGWGGSTGVKGVTTSSSGLTYGVFGQCNSPGGRGVYGEHSANSGTGVGVEGVTNSDSTWATGVLGNASSIATNSLNDYTIGVAGYSQGGDGIGVYGRATHDWTNHPTFGGYFESNSPNGRGVFAKAEGAYAFAGHFLGRSYFDGKVGIGVVDPAYSLHVVDETESIVGVATSDFDGAVGIVGETNATDETAAGVRGIAASTSAIDNDAVGVHGISYSTGVGHSGQGSAVGVKGEGAYGVKADATYIGLKAVVHIPEQNNAYAVHASMIGAGGRAVIEANTGLCPDALAADFGGDVLIGGSLSKAGGSFKIDHPLDPENKYLYHSFVESPDMMNIYNGNVTTDSSGEAWVQLPEWFSALNKDFRYQLTVIGEFAQAIIADKIQDDRFRIRTDKPGIEVSWQVTGIRQDRWAEAHRIPVEEQKPIDEQGTYFHPDLYGKTMEHSYNWKKMPESYKRDARQYLKERAAEQGQGGE
jgi:hypothetical protein